MRLLAFLTLVVFSLSSWAADLTYEQLHSLLNGDDVVIIDVRSQEEHQAGALPGSINIPHNRIASGVAQRAIEQDKTIVLYCRSGRRSGMAEQELRARGYQKIINAGGFDDLKAILGK